MIKLLMSDIEDILALTPLQEGMLFQYLKEANSLEYFEQLSINLIGNIDLNIFIKAWNFVVMQNEMLRTVFRWDRLKKPVQIILKEREAKVKFYDFEQYSDDNKFELMNKIILRDTEQKINLENTPFIITLCKLGFRNYQMIISNHHILWDGWSTGIILKEFQNAYLNNFFGIKSELIKKCKFKEYLKFIRMQSKDNQYRYWSKYLKGINSTNNVFTSNENITQKLFDKSSIILENNIFEDVKRFSKKHMTTFATLFYACWAIVLKKYYNSNDVIFGKTVSVRESSIKNIESVVGLLINTVPLRIQIDDNQKISELIHSLSVMLRNQEEYHHTSLMDIKTYTNLRYGEIFNSVVTIENYPIDESLFKRNEELSFNSFCINETTNFDLTVTITIKQDLKIEIVYNQVNFSNSTINYLLLYLKKVLEDISTYKCKVINELCLLDRNEKSQLLNNFNDDLR